MSSLHSIGSTENLFSPIHNDASFDDISNSPFETKFSFELYDKFDEQKYEIKLDQTNESILNNPESSCTSSHSSSSKNDSKHSQSQAVNKKNEKMKINLQTSSPKLGKLHFETAKKSVENKKNSEKHDQCSKKELKRIKTSRPATLNLSKTGPLKKVDFKVVETNKLSSNEEENKKAELCSSSEKNTLKKEKLIAPNSNSNMPIAIEKCVNDKNSKTTEFNKSKSTNNGKSTPSQTPFETSVERMVRDHLSYECDKIRQNIYIQQMSFHRQINKIKEELETQHNITTQNLCILAQDLKKLNTL